jgi:3-deoxy-7-phosphoheptulonate synthase
MRTQQTAISNVNVVSQDLLPTPIEVQARFPLSERARATVLAGRETVQRILDRADARVMFVVGPCSIHDVKAAREYAVRLKQLADDLSDAFCIIMRVYFEKPRTTVGWKGLINDPYMDDSFHIEQGLGMARELLLEIAELGLPAGTEALDPISPQYLSDLIAWTAIGARTTESQTHREMASGLSTPVGFKNGTDGGLKVAINALQAASQPHSFLGIDQDGRCAVMRTRGNAYGHVVLRGGAKPNYDSVSVALSEKELAAAKLRQTLIVDCSHGNSNKDPALQELVLHDCVNQIVDGNKSIAGFMIESNLEWGNQSIPEDRAKLKYGVSVTDACVDWKTTEKMLRDAYAKLKPVLAKRNGS